MLLSIKPRCRDSFTVYWNILASLFLENRWMCDAQSHFSFSNLSTVTPEIGMMWCKRYHTLCDSLFKQ